MQLCTHRQLAGAVVAAPSVHKRLLIFKYSFDVAFPPPELYNRRPRELLTGSIPLGIVLLKPNTPRVGFSESIHTPRLLAAGRGGSAVSVQRAQIRELRLVPNSNAVNRSFLTLFRLAVPGVRGAANQQPGRRRGHG
jgi:hypothetical protein